MESGLKWLLVKSMEQIEGQDTNLHYYRQGQMRDEVGRCSVLRLMLLLIISSLYHHHHLFVLLFCIL